MKIYAKQVPPEYQESFFEPECWPGIIFHGNRWFNSHTTPEFDAIYNRFDGEKRILRALHLVTGKRYDVRTIRGSCQSDWQNIYYPVEEYTRGALDILEADYFNTGTEWIVHDENTDPDGPEDISGFSVYCYGWRTEDIKAEIAEAYGATDAEVILYQHSGYTQIPKWEAI